MKYLKKYQYFKLNESDVYDPDRLIPILNHISNIDGYKEAYSIFIKKISKIDIQDKIEDYFDDPIGSAKIISIYKENDQEWEVEIEYEVYYRDELHNSEYYDELEYVKLNDNTDFSYTISEFILENLLKDPNILMLINKKNFKKINELNYSDDIYDYASSFKTHESLVKALNNLLNTIEEKNYELFKEVEDNLKGNGGSDIATINIDDSDTLDTFAGFEQYYGNTYWNIDYFSNDDYNDYTHETMSIEDLSSYDLQFFINQIMNYKGVIELFTSNAMKKMNEGKYDFNKNDFDSNHYTSKVLKYRNRNNSIDYTKFDTIKKMYNTLLTTVYDKDDELFNKIEEKMESGDNETMSFGWWVGDGERFLHFEYDTESETWGIVYEATLYDEDSDEYYEEDRKRTFEELDISWMLEVMDYFMAHSGVVEILTKDIMKSINENNKIKENNKNLKKFNELFEYETEFRTIID